MKTEAKPALSRREFLKGAGTTAALAVGGLSLSQLPAVETPPRKTRGDSLQLRSQVLGKNANGNSEWQAVSTAYSLVPTQTAFIVCDMWDRHWSRGATERVSVLAPRIDALLRLGRGKGVHIIHAPSDTMSFYAGTPARRRAEQATPVEPPKPLDRPYPPLPIDDSDGGSDTGEKPWFKAWSRQHAAIEIDQERDVISDNGGEIYNYFKAAGVQTVFLMGVHTNMCVLNRSFAIRQMVLWGMKAVLVRDLTDAMYNPAMRPYVSHVEGTRLVVEFIEKFWCPSVASDEFFA